MVSLKKNFFVYRAPFDVSFIVLTAMAVLIVLNWNENFGDSQAHLKQSFITAFNSIKSGNFNLQYKKSISKNKLTVLLKFKIEKSFS